MRLRRYRFVSWGMVLVFSLFLTGSLSAFQAAGGKGNLVGFVFSNNGSTPLQGAVVRVRNVTSGTVYESGKTDTSGVFKFEGLTQGVYAVGVSSTDGSFNGADFIGVAAGETAKVSISLQPYTEAEASAAAVMARDQQDKSESYIGRVVSFSPDTREANVFIERGIVQSGDRIHIKSQATNIYQYVKMLVSSGARMDRVASGQTMTVPVKNSCRSGDFVYVCCKRGVPPLFLAPLGVAAIVGGSASLVTLEQEEEISPYKTTNK